LSRPKRVHPDADSHSRWSSDFAIIPQSRDTNRLWQDGQEEGLRTVLTGGQHDNPTDRRTYDSLGSRTSVTDANGDTTLYVHDTLGRLVRVTDAEGNLTRFSFDDLGNLTEVTQVPA